MVSISDQFEILNLLASQRGVLEYDLRARGGELVCLSTRHEIDILIRSSFVTAQVNKRGLKYFKLVVETNTALRLLRGTLSASKKLTADDSRTWWENRAMYGHHTEHCASFGPRHRQQNLQRAPLAGLYILSN